MDTLYSKFQQLKNEFCNVLFTKCLEKSGKRSNFVLKKSGKLQSDFCMNPGSSDENSVYPSVKCVHCDKTEERSVQLFIPYERSFSL